MPRLRYGVREKEEGDYYTIIYIREFLIQFSMLVVNFLPVQII